MKKILFTGFDPFGKDTTNPSWDAVALLPDETEGAVIVKRHLPVEYDKVAELLRQAIEEEKPDAVISVGQAGGRKAVTPEVIGINLREAGIPDNAGNQPVNTPVVPGGPDAYFSTLPVREMVQSIRTAELPAALSYSAGAFVCNDVLYTLLHHFAGTGTRVGFIHVPFLPQQATNGQPSLPLDQITQALTLAISAL